MNIAFVWYWEGSSRIYDNWHDGLKKAIEIIGRDNEVNVYLDKTVPKDEYDAILVWCPPGSFVLRELLTYKCKKGVLLTTAPITAGGIESLKGCIVYCESTPVYETVRRGGLRAIKAFGTDIKYFTPSGEDKDIDYFYPATFSPWKCQADIAYLGDKLLCVGTVQEDGQDEYTACKDKGVRIEKGYYPADHIVARYRKTRNIIIPALHGSERTVLEAMSMGIIPEVLHKKNEGAYSYIKELEESGFTPREFVVKNYSAQKYAKDIMRSLQ